MSDEEAGPSGPAHASRATRSGLVMSAIPVTLLVAQSWIYVAMTGRGFDFTDESYYFLNYLYWRDFTGLVSFFGAYFELPFRLLGQSVPAIRVFGLVALLMASGFFANSALAFCRRHEGSDDESRLPFGMVILTASLFYFGYFTSLRAPSYNLLALFSMLVATGCLFILVDRNDADKSMSLPAIGYGLALGVCGLDKAPTGVLMFVAHAAFFALANRRWRLRRLIRLSMLVASGVGANLLFLQLVRPGWLSVLREGVIMTNLVGHGGLFDLVKSLLWEVRWAARGVLELCVIAIAVAWVARRIERERRARISIAVVMVTAGCALELASPGVRYLWLPTLGLAALVFWSFETRWRKPSQWTRSDTMGVGLMLLLFVLPLSFSFGTNTPVMEQSQLAAIFPILAILIRLQSLVRRGELTRIALGISLGLLCVPTLALQVQNSSEARYVYRQRTALIDQTLPVQLGAPASTLLVDKDTRDAVVALGAASRSAGLTRRDRVLDLTGDGPGLIFSLGAEPLAVAWVSGGLSGSEANVNRLISRLSVHDLGEAWLFASTNNPRRIVGWQNTLDARLGPGAHELVATIRLRPPYSFQGRAPDTVDVQIWKPHVTAGPPTR